LNMTDNSSLTVDQFEVNGVKVVGNGRATIPANTRRKYGAKEGENVDVTITTEHGDEFTFHDATVTVRGRVCIPKRFRERYGIEEGDWVDLKIMQPQNAQ
jgi:AbrB family looped-hinge helix DNA binding protein